MIKRSVQSRSALRHAMRHPLRRQPRGHVAVALRRPAIAVQPVEPPRLKPNVVLIPDDVAHQNEMMSPVVTE